MHYEFRTLKITVTTAGVPVPLVAESGTDIRVSDFEVYVPAANTGANLYFGYEGFSKTNYGPRPKGTLYNFRIGNGHPTKEGDFFSFKNIYLDSDSDGDIAYIYYQVAVND